MHALPFKDASFDLVVLMHALTYAAKPAQAVAEARACCARAVACCCPAWPGTSTAVVEAYGHVNLGFSEKELRKFAEKAGLRIQPAKPSPASVARRISK
jgi:ubiquinone/menaquinone biosynthesis C-methylase UbiE